MRPALILVGLFHATVLMADDAVVSVPGAPWIRHTIDNTSRGADGVKLGDLNKDGLLDIVTGWEEGGVVRAYLNPGAARARVPWPQITVGEVKNVEEAVFADLDGDGQLEVISGTEGKTCTLYWHRPTGGGWSTQAFPVTVQSQMWMQAVVLELDGLHGPDVLVASKNKGAAISWLQAPEQVKDLGGWSLHKLRDAGWIMSLVPQDMDGDGDADVVFSDRKGAQTGVFWLENPGAEANRKLAVWKEHVIGGQGKQVMFADLGDVNGDGLMDVAVAAKTVEIVLCLRKPDGGWDEHVVKLDGSRLGDAKAVKIADVNGDKLPDLLFTCENAKGALEGIVWLEQQPNGPWKQRTLGGEEGLKYDLMQTLDLDGDGDLDVITCEERDQLGVIWYENPHK